MQEKARGGIIWIDEASLLPIDDLEQVCGLAQSLKARVVLQGDPRQHKAVQRHGNMLEVLADYAGLPVAEINTIQRQKGDVCRSRRGDPRRRSMRRASISSTGSAGSSRARAMTSWSSDYAGIIAERQGRQGKILPRHRSDA